MREKLGIKNIHVHKGPTIIPLDRDAFDVADIDHVATDFQGLNFIVEHCGLPRLDDFCWIATQETNVYAGLAVALPFIHPRKDYFTNVISELLFWLGEDKLLFGSDYGIWTPRWLVDAFMAFELPDEVEAGQGRRPDAAGQEEDPRPQRRAALRHRRRGAEEEDRWGPREGRGVTDEDAAAHDGRARGGGPSSRSAASTTPNSTSRSRICASSTASRSARTASVSIGFRLPTYWCAANFAFLMADDMRREVAALPWVTGVSRSRSASTCMPTRSIAGWRQGLSFQETFGGDAERRPATNSAAPSWSRRSSGGRKRCCGIFLPIGMTPRTLCRV